MTCFKIQSISIFKTTERRTTLQSRRFPAGIRTWNPPNGKL